MLNARVAWKIFALFVTDVKVLLVICTLLLALQDSFPLWLP